MAIFPPPAADQRLVGTQDLGSFTADEDGSLGEKLQDIRDNVGSVDLNSQPVLLGTDTDYAGISPAFYAALGIGGVSVSAGAAIWDATINAMVSRNNTGSFTTVEVTIPSAFATFISPYGRGGGAPGFDWATGQIAVAPGARSVFVIEMQVRWANSVTLNNNVGAGIAAGSGGSDFRAANDSLYVVRKNTGWTLVTSDGSTRSDQSEASDTSDANWHVFRIEWEPTEARLYVDGVLKVTKTNNLPDYTVATNATFLNRLLVRTDSSNSTDVLRWRATAVYWKS